MTGTGRENIFFFATLHTILLSYYKKNIDWQTLLPPSSPLAGNIAGRSFYSCKMAKECQILKHTEQHSSPNQVPQQTLVDSNKTQVCMCFFFFFLGGGKGEGRRLGSSTLMFFIKSVVRQKGWKTLACYPPQVHPFTTTNHADFYLPWKWLTFYFFPHFKRHPVVMSLWANLGGTLLAGEN